MDEISRRHFLKWLGTILAGAVFTDFAYAIPKKQQKRAAQTNKSSCVNFDNYSDEQLLSMLLFGEARNCSDLEMIAVAYTPINRAKDDLHWNGKTLREAILKKTIKTKTIKDKKGKTKKIYFEVYQYSCFNLNDPMRKQIMAPEKYDYKAFIKCCDIARGVLNGKFEDPAGATSYFHPETLGKKRADELREEWKKTMEYIGKIKVGYSEDGKAIYSKHEFFR